MAGSLLTNVIVVDDHELNYQAKRRADYKQPLGNYGYFGEVVGWGYLNALYVTGMGIHGLSFNRDKSLERAEIMSISSFYTLAFTSLIKLTVQSARPGYPEEKDSFPSGHASLAFNFGAVVLAEHGLWWGVPALAAATFISYSRVNDGRHWVSDVVAGATLGASYGLGVYLHRRQQYPKFWFQIIRGDQGDPGVGINVPLD